MTRVCY